MYVDFEIFAVGMFHETGVFSERDLKCNSAMDLACAGFL